MDAIQDWDGARWSIERTGPSQTEGEARRRWTVALLVAVSAVAAWRLSRQKNRSQKVAADMPNPDREESQELEPNGQRPSIEAASKATGIAKNVSAGTTDEPATPELGIQPGAEAGRVAGAVEGGKLVPPIGEGWRWYDPPYRVLLWMLTSWPRKYLHWRLRSRLNNGINCLLPFNEYDRMKAAPPDRHPIRNFVVPNDERVTQGGIWVVEFFPPSFYAGLSKALAKNGWDEPRRALDLIEGSNVERVTQARRGRGFAWSQIGAVADPKYNLSTIHFKREVLPGEFRSIELTAVQLGHSLTAVTAFFRLSDMGEGALNKVWKAPYEPILEWRGLRRPRVQDRRTAATRAVQHERKRIHDLARSWLANRCGGYFSATKAGQPVLDFNMFEKFDPTTSVPTRALSGPLTALGMAGEPLFNFVSPQLPGAVLTQGEPFRTTGSEDLRNCWGLVGAYGIFAALNEQVGYSKPYKVSTLCSMSDDAIRDFLLHVAVVRYTEQLRETLSAAQDTAQKKHRKFSPSEVEQLRRELLTMSLDLPVVARDAATLWDPEWAILTGLQVKAVSKPGQSHPSEDFNLIDYFHKESTQAFEQLLNDDAAYRDVLSTASALGSSAASARLSGRALFVSCTSLFVSAVAFLAADHASGWHYLLAFISDVRSYWTEPLTSTPKR